MFIYQYKIKTPDCCFFRGTPYGLLQSVFECCHWYLLIIIDFSFLGYFSMSAALRSGFSGPWRLSPALRSSLTAFWSFFFTRLFVFGVVAVVPQMLQIWEGVFILQFFLSYTLLPYLVHALTQFAFIKVSLGLVSSSLRVAGLPTVVCNIGPAHLFVWIRQCSTNT